MSETGGALGKRMVGAMFLDVDTFEEVEHDEDATGQAAIVVIMVAVASGIGASGAGLFGALFASVGALVDWVVWAGIVYLVGDKIFGGKATWGEIMRTLGFAQAPGIFWIFAIVPLLGLPVYLAVQLWVAIASFIAIRQGLDIGNAKTAMTIFVGMIVMGLLETIL